MEKKFCKLCGKLLSKNNKSGYCKSCYRKYGMIGENNHFYGKHHTQETKNKIKISCAEASKKLWENSEYREKVIKNATGIKRNDEFKNTQRINALKQFENSEQRKIRAEKMSQSWKEGKIAYSPHLSINRSKQEKNFIELLSKELQDEEILTEQTLHNNESYFFPDVILPKRKIIIEYNGDFWHANPEKYKADDIIHNKITAKEIWERDLCKQKAYMQMGYKTYVVWQKDFLKNKTECVKQFIKKLLNDTNK